MYIGWVHHYVPKLFAALSFLINPFFVYLVFTDKKANLGNYRWLLVYFASFNIAYSIVDILIPLGMHGYRYCFFFFVPDGPFTLNNTYSHYAFLGRCSMVSCGYAILITHFVYRYMIIHRNDIITKHFLGFMTCSFLLCGVYFAIWAFVCQNYMLVTPDIRDYVQNSFHEIYGGDSQTINAIATIYDEVLESSVIRSRIGVVLLITFPLMTIFFYIFIGYKILEELGKTSLQMSQKTKDMQRRLFEALAIQTVIPILVSFSPCMICLLAPAFNIELGRTINYSGVIAFALFPFFDPLAIIFCIPVIRNRVVPMFCGAGAHVGTGNTSSAHTSN